MKKYKVKVFLLLFLLFPVILAYAGDAAEAYQRLQRRALLDAIQKKQGMSKVESIAAQSQGVPAPRASQQVPEKKETIANQGGPTTEAPLAGGIYKGGYYIEGSAGKEAPKSSASQPTAAKETTVLNNNELPDKGEPLAENPSAIEYYIAPGDTMDIVILEEPYYTGENFDKSQKSTPTKDKKPSREYTINADDTLEVLVWQTPDLSKVVIVGPDGKISYPLAGRLQVAGLTIDEVEKRLTEELSKYVKTPHVSVMVSQFAKDRVEQTGVKITSLLDRIGASRAITVGPDGKISYPLIGRFQAAGKSISQLETEIAEKLSPYVKSPRVSIMMTKFTGDKIVILGEIKSPGIYTFYGQLNLLECLALAGDFTEKARKDSVIVIHGNFTKHPEVVRIDMLKIMMKGTNRSDIVLQPNDVVYVPKSYIANFNKFLENIQPFLDTVSSIIYIKQSIK